jgi:hypothetical protein
MSKLKPTKKGKAGKHRAQDTPQVIYVRGLRKARVVTSADLFMIDRIHQGSADNVEGAMAGSQDVRLSNRS